VIAAWGPPCLDQKLHGRERRQARLHVATAHSWRQTAGTSMTLPVKPTLIFPTDAKVKLDDSGPDVRSYFRTREEP